MRQRPRFHKAKKLVPVFDGKAWAHSFKLPTGVLLLLWSFVIGSHSQVATDLYTSEHESAPKVDQFYTERFRQTAKEQQEKLRPRVSLHSSLGEHVPTLAAINAAEEAKVQIKAEQLAAGTTYRWVLAFGVLGLLTVVAMRRLFPDALEQIKERFAPWDAMAGGGASDSERLRVEGQAFAEFVAAFQAGPTASANQSAPAPAESFFSRWPKLLAGLRKQLQEIRQAQDVNARRRLLYDLSREMNTLKGETGMPEMLPVWQMICALEGLSKQLGDQINEVTDSTLRTVAGGLDLLAELCQPGLDAQLLTRRPIRLLAVDDDPVSRHAISFALKRALHSPDLADGGEDGLKLARENRYDVIFLDVEMPDMDGFELCTQIHKTLPNRTTPVVFVTGRGDFNARVQSTLSGGCELIAKPFLTFELAAKALALAIQNRLREQKAAESESGAAANAAKETVPNLKELQTDDTRPVTPPVTAPTPAQLPGETDSPPVELRSPTAADTVEIATEFLTRAPEHLGWVNETLWRALHQADESAWLPALADVYLRLNSFTPGTKFSKGHPVIQLSCALEKLLRKLLQTATPPTKGTMLTVLVAVDLLHELCAASTPVLTPQAAPHILVVDDDPVARRALTLALQATFAKPVCAADGPAALAQAAETDFDLIFLDVQMPGMDGFEVFSRLRSAGRNVRTPIVFVSGRADVGNVVEVNAHGDCDAVIKPFQPGELLVKALTLMLRREKDKALAAI